MNLGVISPGRTGNRPDVGVAGPPGKLTRMKINLVSQAIAQGRRYVRENPEQVQAAAHKAGQFLNTKTKGKYADKITKAESAADRYLTKQKMKSVRPGNTTNFR